MKRKNIMILMISLSLVLLLGSSYALLRSTAVGSTPYVINVGTLQVTFEGNTDKLSLENMYPMSDKEGSSRSEELGFVVKNTGNVEARYNVYLEETSTNPEFKNHIRFISNKNSEGYNDPKTMGFDKYIDLEARLDSEASVSYKVKIWLDEDAKEEYMDKTFTAKVVVESNQVDTENTLYTKINAEIEKHPNTTIVEDNITYLSGSNTDVNYNYVWYSGKLWRITSINSDGTIKMITEKPITTLSWGENSNYETSWAKEFLNEEFLDTLYNYQNIIVTDYSWNDTVTENADIKIPETTMVKASVGLLTVYEYKKTYERTTLANRYLGNMFNQFLLNPNLEDNLWTMTIVGVEIASTNSLTAPFGISPAIVLKSNIVISTGDGSSSNPYRLKGDKEIIINQHLNERLSGEYVKFDSQLYRILEVESNKTTKLVTADYLKNDNEIVTKKYSKENSYYASSFNDSSEEYWDYYLNNTWYNAIEDSYKNMLVNNIYYLGSRLTKTSYKTTICVNYDVPIKKCDKISLTWTGKVGLLRYGEMFAVQTYKDYITNRDFVLMTPYNQTNITGIREGWNTSFGISELLPTKVTITLSDKVLIVSGTGTEQDPYEISCSNCNNA